MTEANMIRAGLEEAVAIAEGRARPARVERLKVERVASRRTRKPRH